MDDEVDVDGLGAKLYELGLCLVSESERFAKLALLDRIKMDEETKSLL